MDYMDHAWAKGAHRDTLPTSWRWPHNANGLDTYYMDYIDTRLRIRKLLFFSK